jgi:hypothetical protein
MPSALNGCSSLIKLVSAPKECSSTFVGSVFGHFDESGKWNDHKVISFGGLISPVSDWESFGNEWVRLLQKHEVSSMHMTSSLNFTRKTSARKALGFDERLKVLSEFINAIKENIELGEACCVDIPEFRSAPKERLGVYRDPYLLAFATVIKRVADGLSGGDKLSIICDDEEHYAIRCYRLLAQAKNTFRYLRRTITSICFGDDKQMIQLQAADMFAYLLRSEAELRLYGTDYKYRPLYEQLSSPSGSSRLAFSAIFYDKGNLSRLSKASGARVTR